METFMVRGLSYWTPFCFLHTSNSNPENGCFLFTAEEVVRFVLNTHLLLWWMHFLNVYTTHSHAHIERLQRKTRRKHWCCLCNASQTWSTGNVRWRGFEMKAILGFRHGMNASSVCNVSYAVVLCQLKLFDKIDARRSSSELRTHLLKLFFGAVLSRTFRNELKKNK